MVPTVYHIKNHTHFDIVVNQHTPSTLICSVASASDPRRRSLAVRIPRWKQLAAKTGSVKWHEVACSYEVDEELKNRPWRRQRQRDSGKSERSCRVVNEKTGLLWKEEVDTVALCSTKKKPPLKAYYRRVSIFGSAPVEDLLPWPTHHRLMT